MPTRSTKHDADPANYPLQKSLGYHMRETSDAWTQLLHVHTEALGVTQGQWRYLRELWENDGLSQRELSERVGRQGATTVAAMKSLERSGYAYVEPNALDRRKTRVLLTDRGKALKKTLLPLVREIEHQVIEGISSEDLACFLKVLARMHANVEVAGRVRPPQFADAAVG